MPDSFFNKPAATALYKALIADDPFYITLERKADPSSCDAMLRYMDYALKEASEHGQLTLPPDKTSGAAIWSTPLPGELSQKLSVRKKQFLNAHLGGDSLKAYCQMVEFMEIHSADAIPSKAWYLSILGVDPERQGQGLGKRLLAPVLKKTDALGVATFLESFTPKNFGFYERLGFKQTKTVLEPLTQTHYTVMVRQPQS